MGMVWEREWERKWEEWVVYRPTSNLLWLLLPILSYDLVKRA